MNPIFFAAAAAGAAAAKNRETGGTYRPPATDLPRHYWTVQDSRVEGREFNYAGDIGTEVVRGRLRLKPGETVLATEFEARKTHPRSSHLLKTAGAVALTAVSAAAGWPLLVTGIFGGVALVEGVLAGTSKSVDEDAQAFKTAELSVGDHPRSEGAQAVFYRQIEGPGGDHNPVVLTPIWHHDTR